jgi:hypothetical protein
LVIRNGPGLLPLRRADHQHGRNHVGEEAERRLRVDRDRAVVDLLIAIEHIDERPNDRRGRRIELRRFLVVEAIEVPDHRVCGQRRAIMERDAVAQRKDPARMVAPINLPRSGEAGCQSGDLIGPGEVPIDQPIERRKAEKAKPFAAIIRNPCGSRDIRRGHRNS